MLDNINLYLGLQDSNRKDYVKYIPSYVGMKHAIIEVFHDSTNYTRVYSTELDSCYTYGLDNISKFVSISLQYAIWYYSYTERNLYNNQMYNIMNLD